MNASIASAIAAPPATTIADAVTLLNAIADPKAAKAWLDSVGQAVADLASIQADVNAKVADMVSRETALQVLSDNLAKGVAKLAADQAAYEAKASALKAALAG